MKGLFLKSFGFGRRRMYVDHRNYFMINLHKSMGPAGMELTAPGSAIGLPTYCPTGPG